MRKKRSHTLANCIAYMVLLFGVAYAWPWVLEVSPSLPDVGGFPATESLAPTVVARTPEGPGSEGASESGSPGEAGSSASGAAGEPGDLVSTPAAPGSRAKAPKPVYPSGYVDGGKVVVALPVAEGSTAAHLERQLATLSEGDCLDFGPWQEVEPLNVIPDGSCARYRTVVGEDPAEEVVSAAENVVRRDDTPPVSPEPVISEAGENAHAAGDTLFYRDAEDQAGTFTVAVDAADPESGVTQVRFPALGDTTGTSQAGPDAQLRYAWSRSASANGPTEGQVVVTNGAGSESEAPVQMVADADLPAGGSLSYLGGLHGDGRVEVTVDPGKDATSGVDRASGVLEEQEARLTGGRCGRSWGLWHVADPSGSPGHPACVRFRYRVSDNVGNEVTYESSIVAKVVDRERPTVALVAPGQGTTVSGQVNLSAQAEDGGFGVASVRFELRRSGKCEERWRTIATVATTPYGAVWTTSSVRPGRYRLRAVATDRAGNSSTSDSVTVQIAKPVSTEPPDDDGGDSGDPPAAPGDEDADDDEASSAAASSGTADAASPGTGAEPAGQPAPEDSGSASDDSSPPRAEDEAGPGGGSGDGDVTPP